MTTHSFSKVFLFGFLILGGQAKASLSFPSWVCTKLLGSEDAPDALVYMKEARKAYGIANSKRPVKYITPSCSWLQQFESFTWFGTWVNKKSWAYSSPSQKVWRAFHEIAHEAYSHPEKVITAIATTFATSILFSFWVTKNIQTPALKYLLRGGIVGLINSICIPLFSQVAEIQADLHAAEILCNTGHADVVQEHLNQLNKMVENGLENYSRWFPIVSNQIVYIKYILDMHALNTIRDMQALGHKLDCALNKEEKVQLEPAAEQEI
jgi:hypothetical protein